ncbi:MAG: hypothetical protein WD231_03440 [Candidatus Woykebacteria bacterium]
MSQIFFEKQSAQGQTPTRKRTFITITAVILGLLVIVVAGYFVRKESSVTGKPEQAVSKMQEKGKVTTVETQNGPIKIEEGKVADAFPKDVAIYANAKVETSTEAFDGVSLKLKTADNADKITGFYKDKLSENGWTEVAINNMEGSSLITAKKEGRELVITSISEESSSDTSIAIVILNPQKT